MNAIVLPFVKLIAGIMDLIGVETLALKRITGSSEGIAVIVNDTEFDSVEDFLKNLPDCDDGCCDCADCVDEVLAERDAEVEAEEEDTCEDCGEDYLDCTCMDDDDDDDKSDPDERCPECGWHPSGCECEEEIDDDEEEDDPSEDEDPRVVELEEQLSQAQEDLETAEANQTMDRGMKMSLIASLKERIEKIEADLERAEDGQDF